MRSPPTLRTKSDRMEKVATTLRRSGAWAMAALDSVAAAIRNAATYLLRDIEVLRVKVVRLPSAPRPDKPEKPALRAEEEG